MTGYILRVSLPIALGVTGFGLLHAQAPATDELSGYRTVATAIAAKVRPVSGGAVGLTGYLGAAIQRDSQGRLVVEEVQPDSPADRAGMKKSDIVTQVGGQTVKSPEAFREWLQTHGPGETVKFTLLRSGQSVEITAALSATSRPM